MKSDSAPLSQSNLISISLLVLVHLLMNIFLKSRQTELYFHSLTSRKASNRSHCPKIILGVHARVDQILSAEFTEFHDIIRKASCTRMCNINHLILLLEFVYGSTLHQGIRLTQKETVLAFGFKA